MITTCLRLIDWFIPHTIRHEASDLSLARNFVFTHLAGPTLGQAIAIFLYFADPSPGVAFWTIEGAICVFWTLPFALKATGNLRIPAYISVQTLTFVALFGSFFYGGVSSPFLPWLLVALLLGFFYLANRPVLILGSLVLQLAVFMAFSVSSSGYPGRVPVPDLATVALISALSATIYMWWMAVYYAYVISQQSAIEREAQNHRETYSSLLRAIDDAENASRAKSIFLAKMSHELRTPLNAVIGYSELLLDDLQATGGRVAADIRQINAAGRLLLGLVDEVLDLRRIESSELRIESDWFDVTEMLNNLAATARGLMDVNHNGFQIEIDPLLGHARTDATKLRQVLLNLLSNAAKFTKNGAVTLIARRDRKPGGDWLRLQVRDTGIGIDAKAIETLFGNFSQASLTTAREYGGTGLGLFISQKFCALMGGGISVDSDPGNGSTFTISVPAELPSMAGYGEEDVRLIA